MEIMTKKELRKKLKELNLFEKITIGNLVIKKCSRDYAVKDAGSESDLMHDYNAYTYGFKLTWVINLCINKGFVEGEK